MSDTLHKMSMDEFRRQREEVLASWPTGKDVDFQEAVDYHKSLPDSKVFSKKLEMARKEKITLIQPRAGVPLIDKHIELMQFLEKEGHADLLPTTIDSYTRHNLYHDCEKGIQESIAQGKDMLNGFPAVNHGVANCRRVTESVSVPMQIRHGTPDARLLTEIAYAGGFTSYEGGGISYNVPYAKDRTIDETIRYWKYTDRLTGLYEEAGVQIDREPYGPLTGHSGPPRASPTLWLSMEALLAAEQGVKHISVGYGQCGNLYQDIGAIYALEEVTREYLDRFGFTDVSISTVFHQWMGGFPQDEAQAFAIISLGRCHCCFGRRHQSDRQIAPRGFRHPHKRSQRRRPATPPSSWPTCSPARPCTTAPAPWLKST